MNRETCIYRERLAQFTHRADTKETWEKRWSSVDLRQVYHWADQGALGVYRKSFLKHLPYGGLIVEAGCGTGRYVRALISYGYRIVGIEWEEQIIKRAKQVWPNAPLICGDVRCFPLVDQSVVAVVSLGVIEHFEDPWQVLRDTTRILQSGGILYLVVPYANHLRRFLAARGKYPKRADGRGFYQYFLSDDEIGSALQAIGFEVKTSFSTNAFAGLKNEFPCLGNLRRLPYAHRLINGLDRLRFLGPWFGHVVHYIAEKRVS
ncbi:MAG: methyltransferase domain-containing protein [Anaerolineae bacterium]|nr:methyltransferase domain-containing protein [Anaerolineae bacterium]